MHPVTTKPDRAKGDVDEEITEDLLDRIPDVDGQEEAQAPESFRFPAFTSMPETTSKQEHGFGLAPPDVAGVLAEVRKQMEVVFSQELDRIESSFGSLLQDMEAKLAQAQMELEAARAENDRVKAENGRKAEALRELKKTLESL